MRPSRATAPAAPPRVLAMAAPRPACGCWTPATAPARPSCLDGAPGQRPHPAAAARVHCASLPLACCHSSSAPLKRPLPCLAWRRGCVAEDTLGWVNRTAHHLSPAPSLAFVHIPVPQVCAPRLHAPPSAPFGRPGLPEPAAQTTQRCAVGGDRGESLAGCVQFQDVWWDAPTRGRKLEDVACSVRDTGLLGVAK